MKRQTILVTIIVFLFFTTIMRADIYMSTNSIIETTSESYVAEYGTGTKMPHSLSNLTFTVPSNGADESYYFTSEAIGRNCELRSEVTSDFLFDTNLIYASANGSSYSDIINCEAGYYGSTDSRFITNLQFYTNMPIDIKWQYAANGSPGPLGSSDKIDMLLFIFEYSDSTYSTGLSTITTSFYGAGSASESYTLASGYYNLVTQGRVNFHGPANQDGFSQWSYDYSVQTVPIPSAVILGSIGLTFSGWLLRRRRML